MRTALVTGASGFVGVWLCRALADRDVRVIAVVRRPPDGLLGALGPPRQSRVRIVETLQITPDLVEATAPEAIFHLAGQSQVDKARADPAQAFEANARGTWALLAAVQASGLAPRIVFASTDAVYGEAPGRPSEEGDPLLGSGPYELSKAAGEAAAFAFAAIGLPVVVARLGNVYGEGDANRSRLIPSVVAALRAGHRPELRARDSIRAYLHVEDCVAGLIALATAEAALVNGRAVNIVSERPVSNISLVDLVLDLMRRPDLRPLEHVGACETTRRISSAALARRLLGWSETFTLKQGLARLLELETHVQG